MPIACFTPADWCPIQKPTGSHRPILIESVWLKVSNHVLLQTVSECPNNRRPKAGNLELARRARAHIPSAPQATTASTAGHGDMPRDEARYKQQSALPSLVGPLGWTSMASAMTRA